MGYGDTVKATYPEFVGLAESVIVILWYPSVEAGTTKVVPENDPSALVVVVPLSVRLFSSNLAVSCELGAKPEPETEIVEPAEPAVGFSVTEGAVKASAIVIQYPAPLNVKFTQRLVCGVETSM